MSDPVRGPGSSPEAVLSLATAITERNIVEARISQEETYRIAEIPSLPLSLEAQKAVQIGHTALLLKMLGEPETTLTPDDLAAFVGGVLKERVSLFEGESVANEVLNVSAREVLSSPEMIAKKTIFLKRQLMAARHIAAAHNVTVEAVFLDDDLYKELFRQAYSLEEFVEESVEMVDLLAKNTIRSILDNITTTLVRAELDNDSEISEAEIVEILQELYQTPEVRAALDFGINQMKASRKASVLAKIQRFWGLSSEELPAHIKYVLEKLNTSEIGPLPEGFEEQIFLQQKRDRVARTYCMQQGWDFNALTTEQIREIRSQPHWIDPGH